MRNVFWRPHRDKEYSVYSVTASTKSKASPLPLFSLAYQVDNTQFQHSTEAVPTATTAPIILMDTVSIEDVSSNLNAVASTAATDDNNSLNSKLKLNGGSLIEILSNMPYVLSIIGQSGPICDKINKDF